MGDIGKYKDYPDLELSKAIGIIERIHKDFDGRISASNLARLFGIEPRGGGFANRVKDVMAYGLLEGKGEYTLTKLGTRIVENPNDVEARAQAFLNVPLFKAIHAHFKGKVPESNEIFVSRLKEVAGSEHQEASIRAARLRNHYNEALRYLAPDKFEASDEIQMKPSDHSENLSGGNQPSNLLVVPHDYERLIGSDFIIGTKKDPESVDMLESQVIPWIKGLKKKFGSPSKTPSD